ncbi:hypothetical protein [Aquabacterium sp.]|uniref:hypothetical protein n=1 Tax=Aquabacterium sp. TaxID=1872578 RepID=UPI0037837B18
MRPCLSPRAAPLPAALAALLLVLAGCASPYALNAVLASGQGIGVVEGMRLAARAMQSIGYFATRQSEALGQVIGERNGKDSFGADVMTLTIDARVSPAAAGALQLQATCSVSKNIAYTDQLDDECEKFRRAFERQLADRAAARGPGLAVPERAAPQRPAPAAPASAPARREPYSL